MNDDDLNLEGLCNIPLFSIGHNVYNLQRQNQEYRTNTERTLFTSPKFLRWMYLQTHQIEYKTK